MEFVMETDLAVALPQFISFNYDQLKGELAEKLKNYEGLVVTEETIKEAKNDRATLNRLCKALEDKRKEVKSACLAPYNDFEAKVKELVGLIMAPMAAIDNQLTAFEERRREDRRVEVEAAYAELVGDLADILPLTAIWKDGWFNATVTVKKVREEISARISKVRADLEILSTVESEFAEPVKMKYLETLDVSAALKERVRLYEQAKKLREYEAAQRRQVAMAALDRAEQGRQEPPAEAEDQQPVPVPEGVLEANFKDVTPDHPQEATGEKRYTLAFACELTLAQAAALKKFLVDNAIKYRRVTL